MGFKNRMQGNNELLGDDIMRKKQLIRISRLWNYNETKGVSNNIERNIDPTMMINKTLV